MNLIRVSSFGFRIFRRAPFAGTFAVVSHGRLVMAVDRAVFLRALGLVMARAPAAVDGGVAVDLPKQGGSAVRYSAADDAKRTTFADRRAGFPLGIDSHGPNLPQAGGGEFAQGLQKIPRYARRCC